MWQKCLPLDTAKCSWGTRSFPSEIHCCKGKWSTPWIPRALTSKSLNAPANASTHWTTQPQRVAVLSSWVLFIVLQGKKSLVDLATKTSMVRQQIKPTHFFSPVVFLKWRKNIHPPEHFWLGKVKDDSPHRKEFTVDPNCELRKQPISKQIHQKDRHLKSLFEWKCSIQYGNDGVKHLGL